MDEEQKVNATDFLEVLTNGLPKLLLGFYVLTTSMQMQLLLPSYDSWLAIAALLTSAYVLVGGISNLSSAFIRACQTIYQMPPIKAWVYHIKEKQKAKEPVKQ